MKPHELVAQWRADAAQKRIAAVTHDRRGDWGEAIDANAQAFIRDDCATKLESILAADAEARAETVLPKIIEYLAAHPTHEIVFVHAVIGEDATWMALEYDGYRQADVVTLGDDPGAVVLATLANWMQANRGGAR